MPKEAAEEMMRAQVKAFNEKAEAQAATIDEGSSYITPGMQDAYEKAKAKTTAAASGAAAAISDALGGPARGNAMSSSGETLQKAKDGLRSTLHKAGGAMSSAVGRPGSLSSTETSGKQIQPLVCFREVLYAENVLDRIFK